jgi:methylornithine synthase
MNSSHLSHILHKATHGSSLSHEETTQLLSLKDSDSIQKVMRAARTVREQYFDNKIFFYGFIYFSTYCRNHCTFCFYRKANRKSPRYRKSVAGVVETANRLAQSGVHLIDLTMGEDPLVYNTGNFSNLFQMIKGIKGKTGISVMVSPGVVPNETLGIFAELETDWYALYQETHNPLLFQKLRSGQSFEERCAKRKAARQAGMLVEDGILLGVGESIFDRANSIMDMKSNGVHQTRVMSLVPQPQTPFANMPNPRRIIECQCIAVMRLVMPDRLIPASLDVDGIEGLKMRLESGANVVTSIIPPYDRLAGVSQSSLDIETGLRTTAEVKKVLTHMKLCAAGIEEYEFWVTLQKRQEKEREKCRDANRYSGRTTPGFGSGIPGQASRF